MPAVSTNRHDLPAQLDQLVDRVARRPRHGVDDDPLGAGQLVQQGGLADVRPAEQRYPSRAAALVGPADRRHPRQHLEDRVEQVAAPPPVQRRDRPRLAETEVPERGGVRLEPLVVDLVGDEDDRLAGPAQQPDHGLVGVRRADRRRRRRRSTTSARSTATSACSATRRWMPVGADLPAAGVDEGEPAAGPLRVVGHPVAGDARRVLDDGLPPAEDPVDQGGLADVRAAHDGHHRLRPLGERDEAALTGRLEKRAVLVAEVEVLQAGAQDALHALVRLQLGDVGGGGVGPCVGPWVGHVKPRSVCLWCGWADPPLFQAGACSRTTASTAAIASCRSSCRGVDGDDAVRGGDELRTPSSRPGRAARSGRGWRPGCPRRYRRGSPGSAEPAARPRSPSAGRARRRPAPPPW